MTLNLILQVWRLDSVTHRDLEQFSEDVCVVHQLELGLLAGTAAEVNDAVRRLVCRHPELRSLGRLQQSGTIKLGDAGLRCLLTLACLSKLDLTGNREEVKNILYKRICSPLFPFLVLASTHSPYISSKHSKLEVYQVGGGISFNTAGSLTTRTIFKVKQKKYHAF